MERQRLKRRFWGRRGQTATEYMMVISVIVIAAVGATQYLLGSNSPWSKGFKDFDGRVGSQVSRGYIGKSSAN